MTFFLQNNALISSLHANTFFDQTLILCLLGVLFFSNALLCLSVYSGGNHGCVNVRSAISKEVKGDPSCLGTQQRTDMGTKFRKLFPREKFDQAQGPPRQIAMFGSLFCACPEGDSPSAKRQYDAVRLCTRACTSHCSFSSLLVSSLHFALIRVRALP